MPEKILIVDDESTSLKLVQLVLENCGYTTATAKSGEEGFQLAFGFQPDLIILDVNMPGGWSGFEACKNFKACSDFSDIPIIFLTAKTGQLEEGFKLGGADYLLKPLNQQELIVRTRFHLKMRNLVKQVQQTNDNLEAKVQERIQDLTQTNRKLNQVTSERELLEKRLKIEIGTDFLTQLSSGVYFENKLQQRMINRNATDQSGALLFLDLFEFEQINQRFGWEAGDHFLISISRLLVSQFGQSAIIGRLGGDQFAVYLANTNAAAAKKTARGLVDWVSNVPIKWHEHTLQCGVCIGFCIVDNAESSARKAVSKAIQASVIAKDKGVGSVVNFHNQSVKETNEVMHNRLVSALNSNDFLVFYQKVLPTNKDPEQNMSIELLLRLKSGTSERLLLPSEFMDFSRKNGINEKIDLWVVKEAINWIAAYKSSQPKLSHISINIAAESLADPMFLITLENLLSENAIPAHLLCFEVSEQDALISINRTRIFLSRLKALGCQTCIDDFGGQSAIFSHLKELDIDHLKIKGGFVHQLAHNSVNTVVCEMLKNIASLAGKSISVKHLEQEEDAIILNQLGIKYAQGFLLHQPELLDNILITN